MQVLNHAGFEKKFCIMLPKTTASSSVEMKTTAYKPSNSIKLL